MKAIDSKEWIPADDMHLEDNAKNAITAPGNTLVVAGPGAGKTELLAQKSCYLLQTNVCRFPRKILAISFKRDAAFNLKERVRQAPPILFQSDLIHILLMPSPNYWLTVFAIHYPAHIKFREITRYFGRRKIKDTSEELTLHITQHIRSKIMIAG